LPDLDILQEIRAEVADGVAALSDLLALLRAEDGASSAYRDACHAYDERLTNITMGAEWGGLTGLRESIRAIARNLHGLHELEHEKRAALCDQLSEWPALVMRYLESPGSAESAREIVAYLQRPQWAAALGAAAGNALLVQFDRDFAHGADHSVPKPCVSVDPQSASTENTEQSDIVANSNSERSSTKFPMTRDLQPEAAIGVVRVGKDDGDGGDRDRPEPDTEVPAGSDEKTRLLQALRVEIIDVQGELLAAMNVFAAVAAEDPALADSVERYSGVVERLWSTCEVVGLVGLQELCAFVNNNLLELSVRDPATRQSARELFESWPVLVLEYLQEPADMAACRALVKHVQNGRWPSPLTDDIAKQLLQQLVEGPSLSEAACETEARETAARPDDVSLEIPQDINQELLDAFLQEAPAQAAEFSDAIQRFAANAADKESIKLAQRIAHTLKGSAHLTGIRGVATFTHHAEDILEFFALREISPPRELVDSLVETADCVEAMIDSLLGNDAVPANVLAVLQNVLDWANRIDRNLIADDYEATAPSDVAPDPSPTGGEITEEVKTGATAEGAAQRVLRVPTDTVDELLRLVGELSTSLNQIQDRYQRTVQNVQALREQDAFVQHKILELETLVDIRGIGVAHHRLQRIGTTNESFDPLEMNEYNELHGSTQGVIEAVSDARELGISVQEHITAMEELLVQQARLNKAFQHAVMRARMVAVKNIVPRLQRTVRQTCRATGKQARLEVSGENTLIDGEVLQKLADPLMHIIRNAIDHGVESLQERMNRAKPQTGVISLSFTREGNVIVVRCEDDGHGLDYHKIEEKAVELGLVDAGADTTQEELAKLVCTPGFSTAPVATHTSGRGIGLDVVYTEINGMKGALEIGSAPAGGCEITLRLPVSLITAHVLLVKVEDEMFGIPSTALEQILPAGSGSYVESDDSPALRVGENTYPVECLADMIGTVRPQDGTREYEQRPFLLVRADMGLTAVIVDKITDGRELVVKGMGQYVKEVIGVTGASILGDGSVVPVLDLPQMLRAPAKKIAASQAQETTMISGAAVPHVLIVDDSLSARKSLALLAQDAGYATLVAKDGLDAVELMRETRPDIILVDLEMPRMNGLELTSHVRANDETKDVPVIVVTSRSTDKHRQQAARVGASAYVTKPFQENELLDLIHTSLKGTERQDAVG